MEKKGMDAFLEYVPAFRKKHILLLTLLFQFSLFVVLMLGFWWIASKSLFYAGIYHLVISILMILPFSYITINAEEIRKTYREKFGKLAYQKLYYRYIIYENPLGNASRYCRILLKTDYFLPAFVTLPSSFLTSSLLPYYVAIPTGLLLFVIGWMLWNPSREFNIDHHMYVYTVFPEDGRIIQSEMYDIIRHPKYLGECFLALGVGVFANNMVAIIFSLFHIIPTLLLVIIEDKELERRFGESFIDYKKRVPALIPRYGNWKKFVKLLITSRFGRNEKI